MGNPKSKEADKEWRRSLSHQERFLVTHFNPVQLNCFILLKMIKKEIIKKRVPNSLSSYHIKTCMLYMAENTPADFWKPENLLAALVVCLRKITEWVHAGNCPNYFIPQENMFERRIHGSVRRRLNNILQRLAGADCKFLLHIKCGKLGARLQQSFGLTGLTTGPVYQNRIEIATCRFYMNILEQYISGRREYVLNGSTSNNNDARLTLEKRLELLRTLTGTDEITSHTKEETERAKWLLLPYLELDVMTSYIAFALEQGKEDQEIWCYLSSNKWNEISVSSDKFSAKLKQASLFYVVGYCQVSLEILSPLASMNRLTFCPCCYDKGKYVRPEASSILEATQGLSDITTEYLLQKVVIPCVPFLPTENPVTPIALRYEMERSSGLQPASKDDLYEVDRSCSNWAFVDGNFLLHFLLYLNHRKLNMTEANTDIENMEAMMSTDLHYISHVETCMNLLGWVFKDQGNVGRAVEWFKLSLERKPFYNAASCHMKDLAF